MPGPLDGIRVFDLTHAAAGPWGVMLLASLGADVIKVESPGGDLIRLVPPAQKGLGVVYTHSNLGKRSIVLDLKTPHHQSIAHKLVEKADVLMENMRPGAAERLGLGYEQVSRINPRIIYGSSTAWGNVGPMARMGGADSSVQAFCGWTSVSGAPGGKGEVFRHIAHLDLTTSSMFVASILQALLIREKTGKGMRMDLTMVGSAMNLQLSRIAEYFATGKTPPTLGSGCVATVPHQAFICQDKNWLAVGVVNDRQWAPFCRAIGQERLLDDRRLSTNPGRVEHRDELVPHPGGGIPHQAEKLVGDTAYERRRAQRSLPGLWRVATPRPSSGERVHGPHRHSPPRQNALRRAAVEVREDSGQPSACAESGPAHPGSGGRAWHEPGGTGHVSRACR